MATVTEFNNITLTDILMHDKLSDGTEAIVFPITRYDNVMGAPQVYETLSSNISSPFFLYAVETVEVDNDSLESIGLSSLSISGD